MNVMKFTSTRLAEAGKKGILTPDSNGYYEMIVGGLNSLNSAGEYYTLQGAEALFQNSGSLQRRIGKGLLKSELGHPKRRVGETDDQFLERVLYIEETNTSAHFSAIWLDPKFGVNNPKYKNPKLCAVMARLKPSGPHGPALERSLQNPEENVSFSIRALTHNYAYMGQTYRVLTTIITFDQVTEQGISIANKWDAPALESRQKERPVDVPALESYGERLVTTDQLRRIVESTESSISMEHGGRAMAREALISSEIVTLPIIPVYAKW